MANDGQGRGMNGLFMENKKIFVCEDDFVSIMTAVYDAWDFSRGMKHDLVRIELAGMENLELFAEYAEVQPDEDKCAKVVRSIRSKISEEVFGEVFKGTLSDKQDKADVIYHFLVEAFKSGRRVLYKLGNPAVMRLFELTRYVSNEQHRLRGFVRFEELYNGVLFSKIAPVNNVITLIAPHFCDRLPGENWIIYDEKREIAAIHKKHGDWCLTSDTIMLEKIVSTEKESFYKDLWTTFFNTIAIEERKNYKLQRQLMPLRYRENIVEFE